MKVKKLKFSLILCTLNRAAELELCINSIAKQTFNDFEIIVVDQSDNDETEVLIKRYNQLNINYNRVCFRGLSKSRNYGLKLAKGNYFCLIDDDAVYLHNYLEVANKFLANSSYAIISGNIWNPVDNKAATKYDSKKDGKKLSVREITNNCPSPSLIFPMELITKNACMFDERFGVGSVYGAGEETDLIFQARKFGYSVYYVESLKINHPVITHTYELENVNDVIKMKNYYRGFGALHRKWLIDNKMKELAVVVGERIVKNTIKSLGVAGLHKKEMAVASIKGYKDGWKEYAMEVGR